MLAHATTFTIDGLSSRRITVEVDLRRGLPAFTIVGRGDAAVRESRERVQTALVNAGFEFPQRRITVNLAPAHLRKVGPGFDLATACGVLVASEQLPASDLARWAVFGELGLGGELRHCRGVLSVAEGARDAGIAGLIVPRECAREAALVDGLEVAGVTHLREVAAILRGAPAPELPAPISRRATGERDPDLADVRGHSEAIHALTIAAAGAHNILLSGPPGTGKTMLARRLISILPPLTRDEAVAVTRIHSVAGRHVGDELVRKRPFRAPHHSISPSGLVGGGPVPQPGEITLAHHGVLFLDELSEFSRPALESLRQPLEDGTVAIVRGQRTVTLSDALSAGCLHEPVPVWVPRRGPLPLLGGRRRAPPAQAQRTPAGSHGSARRHAATEGRGARWQGGDVLARRARGGPRSARAPGAPARRHRPDDERRADPAPAARPRPSRRRGDEQASRRLHAGHAQRPWSRAHPARRAHDRRPRGLRASRATRTSRGALQLRKEWGLEQAVAA